MYSERIKKGGKSYRIFYL